MKSALPLMALGLLGAALAFASPAVATAAGGDMHRVVFDLTSDNPAVWRTALNNLENAQKVFGVDHTELEVVAYGAGIGLMLKTNKAEATRMEQLARQHVTFAACHNTMQARHLGKEDLLPYVTVVPSGVGELILKQEAGWSYIKTGS